MVILLGPRILESLFLEKFSNYLQRQQGTLARELGVGPDHLGPRPGSALTRGATRASDSPLGLSVLTYQEDNSVTT